jgi:hypothetical protein
MNLTSTSSIEPSKSEGNPATHTPGRQSWLVVVPETLRLLGVHVEDVVSHVCERVRSGEMRREVGDELQRLLDRDREGITAKRAPRRTRSRRRRPRSTVRWTCWSTLALVRKQLESRLGESMQVQQAKQQRLSEVEQRLLRLAALAAAASQFLERLARLDRIWDLLTDRNKERLMATIVESVVVDQQANRVRIEFAQGIPLAELAAPDASGPSGAEAPAEQEVA